MAEPTAKAAQAENDVRPCVSCGRRFETFAGYACGNPLMIAGTPFSELYDPDVECKRICCLTCVKKGECSFQECECSRERDFPQMWCDVCIEGFDKCKSCSAPMCSECKEQGANTKKYGLLCNFCFERMLDKDEELLKTYYPPESDRIRIPSDYIPEHESVQKIQELLGATNTNFQKAKHVQKLFDATNSRKGG